MAISTARKSGWWYPWIFVGGFVVVIAVNLILLYSAVSTFSGLSRENPYEKGLAHNQTLEGARAQEKLGWKVASSIETLGETAQGGRRVRIGASFQDREGQPIEGLQVRAMFIRPAAEGHDQQTVLSNQGQGRYAAEINLPLLGLWELQLVALGAKSSYQTDERIQVR
jgi:nitrogen fixation protein FixH